jgi:hypothetical protein
LGEASGSSTNPRGTGPGGFHCPGEVFEISPCVLSAWPKLPSFGLTANLNKLTTSL